MRTRTKWKFVAKATVLGASVLRGRIVFSVLSRTLRNSSGLKQKKMI